MPSNSPCAAAQSTAVFPQGCISLLHSISQPGPKSRESRCREDIRRKSSLFPVHGHVALSSSGLLASCARCQLAKLSAHRVGVHLRTTRVTMHCAPGHQLQYPCINRPTFDWVHGFVHGFDTYASASCLFLIRLPVAWINMGNLMLLSRILRKL